MTALSLAPVRLKLGLDYEETVGLDDGTFVTLRLVRPTDAPLLIHEFGELSAHSRYMRFFGMKNSLSPTEIRHLLGVDGWNHVAILAVQREPSGEEGVGVARFIRLGNDPEAADFAISVVDRLQGRGLGRILLERLIVAARERGIKRFRFEVLSDNARMLNLVHDVAPSAMRTSDGSETHFDLPLDLPPASAQP
jgi:RimJ/RimL family protein N-acetyltransferase